MKHFVLLLLILFLVACTSKLDKPENEPALLDNSVNVNLKIGIEAFIEKPENRNYLDSSCVKSNQGNYFNFTYSNSP